MQEITYNQDMDDPVRKTLAAEAERRGQSLAELSRKLGKNHAYLQQFIKRGTPGRLPEEVRHSLASLLDVDESLLRPPRAARKPPPPIEPPPSDIFGQRDLKVFAAVEGGPGEMVVSTEPLNVVPRPWFMQEVRDGFAVMVVGESMTPAYGPGDLAIVNPRLPPMRGEDVILIGGEDAGEFRASIKHLVGWDAKQWHLLQHAPPRGQKREFSWAKKDWPKALRVVGKYRG